MLFLSACTKLNDAKLSYASKHRHHSLRHCFERFEIFLLPFPLKRLLVLSDFEFVVSKKTFGKQKLRKLQNAFPNWIRDSKEQLGLRSQLINLSRNLLVEKTDHPCLDRRPSLSLRWLVGRTVTNSIDWWC